MEAPEKRWVAVAQDPGHAVLPTHASSQRYTCLTCGRPWPKEGRLLFLSLADLYAARR
jgi:hypothetical protein